MPAHHRGSRRPGTTRLLFLMHVDWGWIRERSHALAEELDRIGAVPILVVYPISWRRWRLTSNPTAVRRILLPQLPFGRRFGTIRKVNELLARGYLAVVAAAWRPSAVLVPFPSLYAMLPARLRRVPIFYDCMDIAAGFAAQVGEQRRLEDLEQRLIRASTRVFVSSEYLGDKLQEIMPGTRPVLIRNGYDASFGAVAGGNGRHPRPAGGEAERRLRLGYFGTIAHWFDQELVHGALDRNPDLEVHLWGPITAHLEPHARLHHHGVVPHRSLAERVAAMDALIMPFVVSELVEGTDPLKLYEYVALGKPAVSVYYPELEQFRGLVHFYSSPQEFDAYVARLRAADPRLTPEPAAAREFLARSTWESRALAMASVIAAEATRQPR